MKFGKFAVLIFAALLSLDAVARKPVAIVNYHDIAVATGSGKAPATKQVKQALMKAAGAKGWTVAQQADSEPGAKAGAKGWAVAQQADGEPIAKDKSSGLPRYVPPAAARQADGKLLATHSVRGKYTIVIEIAYSAEKYSLTYKDSTNMGYRQRDGQPMIHPYYNKWVAELKEAIRLELFTL